MPASLRCRDKFDYVENPLRNSFVNGKFHKFIKYLTESYRLSVIANRISAVAAKNVEIPKYRQKAASSDTQRKRLQRISAGLGHS